ncbi:MAG TPA: 50S ribosomal protein L32, partial [Bacteroidia bacterium]|nr:50S ribosomal protein L32 [Bacteroidia bacterium]
KARTRSRRSTYKGATPTLGVDQTTGEAHLWHRAHWHEGKLYYKGKVVMEKAVK